MAWVAIVWALEGHACIRVSGHFCFRCALAGPTVHPGQAPSWPSGEKTHWVQVGSLLTHHIHGGGLLEGQFLEMASKHHRSSIAANWGVTQCDPSVLHVQVGALKFTDTVESREPGSEGSPATSCISAGFAEDSYWMDILNDIGDRGIGDLNMFRAGPTNYGVRTFTGVATTNPISGRKMLHNPCILGGPQTKRDKIRIDYLPRAFSGGPQVGGKCYITPVFSGSPNKEGQNQN